MKNCIVSQVHIPPYDVQGSITSEQKKRIVGISITHLRKMNPDSYIILIGHGEKPSDKVVEACDYFHWEELHPLNNRGLVVEMPAQFHFVSRGIKHAKEKGFTHCLKTRADCVIGVPNIVDEAHKIIESENKKLLITQETHRRYPQMGDCFMYGETDLLDSIWDYENPVLCESDGLMNTGLNFIKAMNSTESNWKSLLKQTCSFRNVNTLKFMCLRWNFNFLTDDDIHDILNDNYDYNQYHWGKSNGWASFDADGNILRSPKDWYSENTFYSESLLGEF